MRNQFAQILAIYGCRAIGLGAPTVISGCQELGCWHLRSAFYGLPDGGDGVEPRLSGMPATGVRRLVSMAESTTDSDILVTDMRADVGTTGTSFTTVR